MSEPVFILALSIAATTLVLVARAIAGAVAGRGASRSELADGPASFLIVDPDGNPILVDQHGCGPTV